MTSLPTPDQASPALRVCALAGGVGGARLAHGLQQLLPAGHLSLLINTGDDFSHVGLRICPDLDTVMYTLAGVADVERGWGLAGDTLQTMQMVERYGGPTWFTLGDRDLGTHLVRTHMLGSGQRLTAVTSLLAQGLGVASHLLPMSDAPVATMIHTAAGERLDFQEYFVRRRHDETVAAVELSGIDQASPTPEALAALHTAEAIILTPSNPFVSIAPILGLPAYREALRTTRVPRLAVSPIIGGVAVKGPAAAMMQSLGHACSPLGIARLYQGLIDVLFIDNVDAALVTDIEALGIRPVVTSILMTDIHDRARLAAELLACAAGTLPSP